MWILICCIIIAVIIITIAKTKTTKLTKMSFKEALDLTEVPIITFYNNNIKLNFLLDTGSSMSFIRNTIIDKCTYIQSSESAEYVDINGHVKNSNMCIMNIGYKNNVFKEEFTIADLEAFDILKERFGVQIHGILGNTFFNKYNYVLDYKDYIVYSKK